MIAAHIEYRDRTNWLGRQLPSTWRAENRLLHNRCGNDIELSNPIRMSIVREELNDERDQ